jgi:hypothetical protein
MIKEMVETIAKTIADKPEQVTVKEIEGDRSSIIEVQVAKSDLGKLIGRDGRTAEAIRNLVFACSFKCNKKRFAIEIQSNEE